MKRWLMILCLLFPFGVSAGGPSEPPQSVCYQVGIYDQVSVYATSRVVEGIQEDRESHFATAVQEQTEGEFDSGYDAVCREFGTKERAEKYLKKMLKKAEKRKFSILWINFSTGPQKN